MDCEDCGRGFVTGIYVLELEVMLDKYIISNNVRCICTEYE